MRSFRSARARNANLVSRHHLPEDAPQKGVNVDCSQHFEDTYGAQGPGLSQTHSWYFTDDLFLKELAITLLGTVDRLKIPTRGPGPGRSQILGGQKPQSVVINAT